MCSLVCLRACVRALVGEWVGGCGSELDRKLPFRPLQHATLTNSSHRKAEQRRRCAAFSLRHTCVNATTRNMQKGKAKGGDVSRSIGANANGNKAERHSGENADSHDEVRTCCLESVGKLRAHAKPSRHGLWQLDRQLLIAVDRVEASRTALNQALR